MLFWALAAVLGSALAVLQYRLGGGRHGGFPRALRAVALVFCRAVRPVEISCALVAVSRPAPGPDEGQNDGEKRDSEP